MTKAQIWPENMAGKYRGVQALLKDKNPKCLFAPCGNHTLNLVGVNSAEACVEAVTLFGNVQKLFNIFSSSTSRWKIKKKTSSSISTPHV